MRVVPQRDLFLELEQLQERVLRELDQLNSQIERVIRDHTPLAMGTPARGPTSTPDTAVPASGPPAPATSLVVKPSSRGLVQPARDGSLRPHHDAA